MYSIILYKGCNILSMPYVKFYMSNHFAGCLGPRPGLEGCGKHPLPLTGVATPNCRTLASRYSDYGIPTQTVKEKKKDEFVFDF
jgi:hypothetical protein